MIASIFNTAFFLKGRSNFMGLLITFSSEMKRSIT